MPRPSRLVTHDGRTLALAQWMTLLPVGEGVFIWHVRSRLACGWDLARAVGTPLARYARRLGRSRSDCLTPR